MSGDLWWSNVKLIAHFDGPDIAFNEKQRAVQWDNRLTLSTAEKRFGASSLALPGLEGAGVVYYGGGSDVGDLGPDDFTIEFFFQREYSGSRVDYLVSSRLSNSVHGYSWGLLVDDQDRLIWRGDVRGASDVVLWATPDWPPGLWKHIAVTRSGGTLRCFIDGVQTYSGAGSANYRSPHPVFVGFNGTSDGVWPDGTRTGACHGYMDELRITSGGARYTASFTPPTAPFPNEYGTGGGGGGAGGSASDPYWDNVTLLANWEGPSITTNPKNIPATYAGTVALDTAKKRFGVSSLSLPESSGCAVSFIGTGVGDLGAGDFTVEFFFQSTYAGANIGEPQYLVASTLTGDPASGSWGVMLDVSGNVVWRSLNQSGSANLTLAILQGADAWVPGVWRHIAIARASGILRCFVDGVQTYYGNDATIYNSTYPVLVGTLGSSSPIPGQGYYIGRAAGSIDELRLTRGTARYTTNFPPITTAFPTTGSGGGTPVDPYWNDVLLYLPMDGSNNSSTFTDFSPNPKNVSNSGSVRVSQAQRKYGGTSAYFDGQGWLDVAGMPAEFLQGDFTIEGWVYYTGSSQQTFFNTAPHTVLGVSMNRDGTGKTLFLVGNGTGSWSGAVTSAGALAANSWHHIAVVRSGVTSTLYHNGVAQGSLNDTPGNLSGARIGAITLDSEIITGYIDDFRITKAARYLGDFNPETRDPYLSDVLLYVSGDGEVGSEAEDSGPLALSQTAVVDPVLIAEPPTPLFAGRKAMRFSGNNGAVFSSPEFLFPQSQDWTLECWVLYSVNQTANAETFFSMIPNGPGDAHALLAGVASGFVSVTSYGGGEGGGDSWGSAGNWGFVVIEFFEGIGKVWVNGIYKFAFSGGNPPAFHLRDIAIGLCPGVYGYDPGLNGYLAEVRLTKRARYRGATPPVPSGPFPSTAPVVPEPTTPAIRGNWNFDFRAKVSPETRKDLPPPAAKNFPDRVREEVSTLLGKRGDALDKAVTVRDLVDGGIIQVRPGWQGGTSPVGGFGPAFPQPVEAYEPDLTPPPTPTNLSASAGFGLVYLQTDSPAFTMGHGYGRTRIYGAKRAQGAQAPVFSDAVLVYEFTGTIGAMPSDPATTWHLWAKWRTNDGVDSAAPAGGTNGVVATTGQDPGVLIDTLTGQITEEMLYVDLSNRINLIDGPASLTNSVAARLAAEASARATAISQEASARATAISQEASARGTAITNESNLRSEADSALAQQISTLTANVSGTFATVAALQTEQTARADGDTAQTSARETLATQLRGAYTGTDLTKVTAGLVFSEREARVSADGALSSRAEALEATVNSPTTGLTATRATLTNDYYTKTQTDSAISASATTLSAAVGTKNRTFVQAAAPSPASGRVLGDLWFNTSDNNKLNRFDGTAWVAVDDARIASTQSNLSSNYYTKASTDSAISAATLNLVSNSALTTTLSSYATTATLSNDYYTKTQTDSAISTSSSTLTANFNTTLTGYATTAAIQAEVTARTNADSALASQVSTVQATASGKSANFVQGTTPTATRVDDLWIDTANGNLLKRWNGTAWVAVDDTRLASNATAIATVSTQVSAKSANFVQGTAPTATRVNDLWIDTANGNALKRWNGTAWVAAEDTRIGSTASTVSTLQASTSTLNTKVAALEVSSTAQASDITGLKAQYTVKIDLNGYVAGFGLAANAPNDSGATSSFSVRADRFYVGPPTNYSQEATPSGATAGQIWYRSSDKKFFAWSGTAWEPWKNSLPFIVQTTPQTINGVNVPAGVYMDTAFIKDATISSAMIANLKADKIVSGLVQGNIGVVGAKVAGTEIYVGGAINLDSAQATGILSVTNPDIALNASGATFKVNTFKITQGAGLQTITPFMVDGNGNVIINSAYIGRLTADKIDGKGLTITSADGTKVLLDATLNTPPWVVYGDAQAYVDSLVSAGTGGVALVSPTTSSTNTRYIKSLSAGHGISLSTTNDQVTVATTGSEVDSSAMGVGVNVTTVSAVNGLSVNLDANAVYRLTATIRFRGTSATTPTPVFGLRLPPGASGTAQVTAQVGSVSATEARIINWPPSGDGTATFSAIGAAGAGNQIATIDAVLTTGATGGAASVLAGAGNGISITVDTASAMFAQKIRKVTSASGGTLAASTLAATYAASDRRQSSKAPGPLSSAFIVLTLKSDGTWSLVSSGNLAAPAANGSWRNPSGVVGAGAAWEVMISVANNPSTDVTIGNDTVVNGQAGFVPLSVDRVVSVNAAIRDDGTNSVHPINIFLRPIGSTTFPSAWATVTFDVTAVSNSLV